MSSSAPYVTFEPSEALFLGSKVKYAARGGTKFKSASVGGGRAIYGLVPSLNLYSVKQQSPGPP